MRYGPKPILNLLGVAGLALCLTIAVYFVGYHQGYGAGSQAKTVSAALAAALPADAPPQAINNTPTPEEEEHFRIFWEAWALLKEEFYGDLPDAQQLAYHALQGVIRELGDPHTGFLPPQEAALFSSDMQGSFQGIGARVDLAESGGVLIVEPFVNQPAWEAGLRRGDVILAVDGRDITGLTLLESIGLIRGPEGTTVTLTVYRASEERQFDVQVTRRLIEIPITEARMLDGNIAYLRLAEFNALATRRVREEMSILLANHPDGFILDLRGNPGGLLSSAVDIGSMFVPRGNILIESFRDGREVNHRRRGNLLLPADIPLVVLVDGGSASAAEIVAGALQDTQRATLIGETTLGKGSVQLPHTLSDQSQLRITVAHWLTPNRREINGAGLTPDIVVERTIADIEAGHDPQLERALRFFQDLFAHRDGLVQ